MNLLRHNVYIHPLSSGARDEHTNFLDPAVFRPQLFMSCAGTYIVPHSLFFNMADANEKHDEE